MAEKYKAKAPFRQQIYNEIAQLETEFNRSFDENLQKVHGPVKILGLANFKNGVGKTTISHALADAFAKVHNLKILVISSLLKKRLEDYHLTPAFDIVDTIGEMDTAKFNIVIIDQDELNSVEAVISASDFTIIPGQLGQKIWSETLRTAEYARSLGKPSGILIHKRRHYKNKIDEEMYYNRDEEALMKRNTFQHLINSPVMMRLKDRFLTIPSKNW